jgi:transcriptional regulator with XRE-family HTH domain
MKKLMQIQSNLKVNELIKEEMKKQAVSQVELAERLQIAPSSVYNILESGSIQVSRLETISKALKINFFRIVAEQINIHEPVNAKIEELEEQVRDQRKENEILKEVITLLGANK